MVDRLFIPPEKQSYFLFGARGTGKTSLLERHYKLDPNPPADTFYLDLLDPDQEELFSKFPNRLREIVIERKSYLKKVIVDEIQKVPKLLNVVHFLIEKHKGIQFILTGSSARKLKSGGANLLAGRAAAFNLHPFSCIELGDRMSLMDLLSWGSLPKLLEFSTAIEKQRFLKSYVQVYLKQEVQLEQLVRNILGFREFLELAAQASGEIVSYANISNKSGIDEKTIARYFEILVDTNIGFFLEPHSESIREKQRKKPKFYLFDLGVTRQISGLIDSKLVVGSSDYGRLFEQFIICECFRLNDYKEKSYRFSYLRTAEGAEIDLIVKRSKGKNILIEIKSTDKVISEDYKHLLSLGRDLQHVEKWVLCTEKTARKTSEGVRILPWRQGLEELF